MERPLLAKLTFHLLAVTHLAFCTVGFAADWPTWRHDGGRSATTTEELPAQLHLQWSWQLPTLKPAWPEDPRLHFDASYEPVVAGNTMYVVSSLNDSVTAIDTDTGARRWRFYADGPVRFAPVIRENSVYFGADDGCFYCLDAENGELIGKIQTASTERMAIGNERLISIWPVRGGPVLADGKIQFTSGVWPFEGTFLHEVDVSKRGLNHTNKSLPDLSPQGYLATSGNRLYIPCGRGNVHGIDRTTGKPVRLRYDAKGFTDYHAVAVDKWVFHGDRVIDAEAQKVLQVEPHRPVVDGGRIYFAAKGQAVHYDLNDLKVIKKKDRRGQLVELRVPQLQWRFDDEPVTAVHLKAGSRLYAHHQSQVIAIDLPGEKERPKVSWKATIEGTPSSILAANGKLFVVTKQGKIYCFGAQQNEEPQTFAENVEQTVATGDPVWQKKAAEILAAAGQKDGYCLMVGVGTGVLLQELVRQSDFRIIVLDPDTKRVAELRRRWDKRGLYGTRVVARAGDPLSFALPPYFANLVVSEDVEAAGLDHSRQFAERVFQVLRPYGGAACLDIPDEAHPVLSKAVAQADLPNAEVGRKDGLTILTRAGALPGSADWTHEYGDPSNTLMSRDNLVKAPLGVLWFGGPASDGSLFFDRHRWGPSLTVIDGRMFIQGPSKLTAVDVYTGRILWQKSLPQGLSPGRRGHTTTGFHILAVKDGIYLAYPDKCLRLDPATGKQISAFALPDDEDQWGRIRVWKDVLFVTVFRSSEKKAKQPKAVVALNRHTGKVLWSTAASQSFPFVAVGGNRVYCFDGILHGLYKDWERKGVVPKAEPFLHVKALDARTGEQIWERTANRVVTWLGYSEDHDVLVASNKGGLDGYRGRDGEELWRKNVEGKGFSGHPESVWDKVILWQDRVIDQRGPGSAYNVNTGEQVIQSHPITGRPVPWSFTKTGHHCNYAIANPHLLTFRAANAGYCDIASGATSRLLGFRSGCRNSLIPANGVLNAPNFAHGCICSYNLFTSLALVHVPQNDLWTYSAIKTGKGRVERLGINFGAPGDRRDEDGTMWLEYPSTAGPSPSIPLKFAAEDPKWFRLHSAQIEGAGHRWVAASGVRGVQSVRVPLAIGTNGSGPSTYTVRLTFAEPDDLPPGKRVFDVTIQDNTSFRDVDIVKEAGGSRRMLVKEAQGVSADDEITLGFVRKQGAPLICGVEVIAE